MPFAHSIHVLYTKELVFANSSLVKYYTRLVNSVIGLILNNINLAQKVRTFLFGRLFLCGNNAFWQ